MIFWNSAVFNRFPFLTELIVRFLMNGFTERIIDLFFSKETAIFKIFPFSTDPIYDHMDIKAEDGSGVKHTSDNGNLWLSCNCPDNDERHVEVMLYPTYLSCFSR
jgi:hypothetical protein